MVKELRAALLGREDDSEASGEARAEVAQAAKGRASDPEAHRLFLQGRFLLDRYTPEDTLRGITYFEQALAIEPGFAMAWADISFACSRMGGSGWGPAAEWIPRARAAARRALELEPTLGEAYVSLAWLQLYHDFDWRAAEVSIRHALDLGPPSARALRVAGAVISLTSDPERSLDFYRRALEADPLSSATYQNLGLLYEALGRFAEAERVLRKAIELSPQSRGRHQYLALVLAAQGRYDEARVAAGREPNDWCRLHALAVLEHRAGNGAASDRALAELAERFGDDAAFQVAEVHAARGEADAAFAWLERALAQGDAGVGESRASPRLRSLHGDPRWKPLLRRIGLPED